MFTSDWLLDTFLCRLHRNYGKVILIPKLCEYLRNACTDGFLSDFGLVMSCEAVGDYIKGWSRRLVTIRLPCCCSYN